MRLRYLLNKFQFPYHVVAVLRRIVPILPKHRQQQYLVPASTRFAGAAQIFVASDLT